MVTKTNKDMKNVLKEIKKLEQEVTLLKDVLNIPKQAGILLSSNQQKLLEQMISDKERALHQYYYPKAKNIKQN